MTRRKLKNLSLSAILTAFAILIPLISPVKIIVGPASFTLASHVPIFVATFISPLVAVAVAFGAALGFFLAGFPFVIVMRALSQLLFASVAAFLLTKQPKYLDKAGSTFIFALLINLVHALAEFLVVLAFTWSSQLSPAYWQSLLLLIGLGTLIHGMIDFYLALFVWQYFKPSLKL